jgi:hypothetical protein
MDANKRPYSRACTDYLSVDFSVEALEGSEGSEGSDFFSDSEVLDDRSGVPDGDRWSVE